MAIDDSVALPISASDPAAFTASTQAGRLKLFWSPRSPFVRRVMVAAHELDLAGRIDRVDTVVGMTACHDGLMRLNPLNKIPTLVTGDGFVLSDTLLICQYLDGVAPAPRLYPSGHAEALRAMRWHALGHGLTDLLVLWRNELLRPEAQRSPDVIAAWHAKYAATVARLDEEAALLDAAPLSIGHIALACALGYLDFRFPMLGWRDGVPALASWFGRFEQRASMQATMPAGG
jgi:glutathione S-transferase